MGTFDERRWKEKYKVASRMVTKDIVGRYNDVPLNANLNYSLKDISKVVDGSMFLDVIVYWGGSLERKYTAANGLYGA
eukprot:1091301-Ditylum_brightwellii.AAC.2